MSTELLINLHNHFSLLANMNKQYLDLTPIEQQYRRGYLEGKIDAYAAAAKVMADTARACGAEITELKIDSDGNPL